MNTSGDEIIQSVSNAMEKGVENPNMSEFFASDLWQMLLRVLIIIVVILATYLIKRIVCRVLAKMSHHMLETENASGAALIGFVSHLAAGLLYLGGAILVISCIPALDSALNRLLAAGGVIAVVAGLASQEALGNMVSGIMILAFKPFQLGDIIRYVDNNISGVVDEITVHHTTIRTWENKRVIVPNSKMNSAIIENSDYVDNKVCLFFEIGITYESDMEKAKQVLAQKIVQHPDFFDNRTEEDKQNGAPEVVVRVIELADSAIILRAWVWARNQGTAAAMKSDLMQSVKLAYDEVGIDIAYPHLVVINE